MYITSPARPSANREPVRGFRVVTGPAGITATHPVSPDVTGRSPAMSTIDKVRNSVQRLTGWGRRTAGRVSGDRRLEAQGAKEKISGDVRQAGENLKDTAR